MICILCGKTECAAYDTVITGPEQEQDSDLVVFGMTPVRVGLCEDHIPTFRALRIDDRELLLKEVMRKHPGGGW